MNINWNKWMIELLPLKLRRIRLYALLRVLTSPVYSLHEKLMLFRKRQIWRTSFVPSYKMLEKLIEKEVFFFDNPDWEGISFKNDEENSDSGNNNVTVKIEEEYFDQNTKKWYGGGNPEDFVVVSNDSDMNRQRKMHALIDRYKMAGKTYWYLNNHMVNTYEWGGYVDEHTVTTITVTTDSAGGYPTQYLYTSDKPLYSDIKIVFSLRYRYSGWAGSIVIEFKKGETITGGDRFPSGLEAIEEIRLVQNQGDTYKYILIIKEE